MCRNYSSSGTGNDRQTARQNRARRDARPVHAATGTVLPVSRHNRHQPGQAAITSLAIGPAGVSYCNRIAVCFSAAAEAANLAYNWC